MRKSGFILLLICSAAALAAGWLAGTSLPAKDDVSQTAARPAPSPKAKKSAAEKTPPDMETEAKAIALRKGPERAAAALAFCKKRGAAGLAAMLKAALGDRALMDLLMNAWKEEDPHTLLRVLANSDFLQMDGYEGWEYMNLTQMLAKQNVDRALQTAAGIRDPRLRRQAVGAMIGASFHTDPRKALELAKAHPGVRLWADLNLDEIEMTAEMIPALAALPRSISQTELLLDAMRSMPAPEAWEKAQEFDGLMKWRAWSEAAKNWAQKDLEGAVKRAAEPGLPAGARAALHQSISGELMKTDPSAAADWAEEHLSGQYKIKVLGEAAKALQRKDPDKAAELRARLPEAYKASVE